MLIIYISLTPNLYRFGNTEVPLYIEVLATKFISEIYWYHTILVLFISVMISIGFLSDILVLEPFFFY